MTSPTPDPTPAAPCDRILPGSVPPCGCYVRVPGYHAVMCDEHAARRAERREAAHGRRRERARAAEARIPWKGPGGRAFGGALLTAGLAVVFAAMWTEAADQQSAFDDGYASTSAVVEDYTAGFRGSRSYYDITFTAAGDRHHAELEDYDSPSPEIGDTIRIDYATSAPQVVRTSGYDSAADTEVFGAFALVGTASTTVLVGWWVTARRRPRAAGLTSR